MHTLCNQLLAPRILHHESPALERPLRVEWQVCTTRIQHTEHAHHLLERAVELQRHHTVSHHALCTQPLRHTLGTRLQLGVCHRLTLPLECDGVGLARRLRCHEVVDAQVGRVVGRRALEDREHSPLLLRRDERQCPHISFSRNAAERLG